MKGKTTKIDDIELSNSTSRVFSIEDTPEIDCGEYDEFKLSDAELAKINSE